MDFSKKNVRGAFENVLFNFYIKWFGSKCIVIKIICYLSERFLWYLPIFLCSVFLRYNGVIDDPFRSDQVNIWVIFINKLIIISYNLSSGCWTFNNVRDLIYVSFSVLWRWDDLCFFDAVFLYTQVITIYIFFQLSGVRKYHKYDNIYIDFWFTFTAVRNE